MPGYEVTRSEHLAWCKERALAYLPGDPAQALASLLSDLRKHDETANHPAIQVTLHLAMSGHLDTVPELRRHIEGFR